MMFLALILLSAMLSFPMTGAVLRAYDCEYEHCFIVNNSASNGSGSFQEALASARAYNSSVEIRLLNGYFQLPGNGVAYFEYFNEFVIVGVSSGVTTIGCENNMGLSFYKSRYLKFANISITNCGFEFNTTSVNLTKVEESDETSFLISKTGILFNLCSDLSFKNVTVELSKGTGITIYNTNGYNYFYNCTVFANNYIGKKYISAFPGGGGIVIETSHCHPGDTSCNDSVSVVRETRDASYIFENCEFSSNQAYRSGAFSASYPHGTSHMNLGKGGGLSVTLKGRALNNTVLINNCCFLVNHGESGGALHLSFGDTSINNQVEICCGTGFESNNGQIFDAPYQIIGGAVRISMVSFPEKESKELWGGYVSEMYGNNITFVDTDFSTNFATWGGAVSFTTTRNVPNQTASNFLHFLRCRFRQNRADLSSSAIDISAWKPSVIDNQDWYMVPVVENCIFVDNELFFRDITNRVVGFGTVYIDGIQTEFCGNNSFFQNTDTPLVISNTIVKISNDSVLNFTGNSGRRGGALSLIGDAYMVVGEGTHVIFDSNSVGDDGYGFGGAVYAVHFGNHDRYQRQDCFFQYYIYGVPPKRWNATFVFSNNMANNEINSIYTTSLAPCVWSNVGVWDDTPENNAFCDDNTWIFKGNGRTCRNEIMTGPSTIKIEHLELNVVPGWTTPLNVSAFDDYNNAVSTALLASPSLGNFTVANTTRYILNDEIIIYGSPNDSGNSLLLMTPDPRVLASNVKVNILDCPVGFAPLNCSEPSLSGYLCDCICQREINGVSCSDSTKDVYLYKYNCVSQASNESGSGSLLNIARCPYNLKANISLKGKRPADLNDNVCRYFNRVGHLCSHCRDNFGVSTTAYNYKCVECTKGVNYDWLLFLLLELGPITVVCFIVVLFKVNVASPYMNAFVFFAQIVSVKYFHNSFSWIMGVDFVNHDLSKPVTLLYGVWNLDFFRDFVDICLHPKLNTLHVLLINYIKAFYPMMVLVVCYSCIKLYDRNFRLLHILWKPFRYCVKVVQGKRHSTTSIIDAFTTLFILSYTKVLYVSFPLVAPVTIYTTKVDRNVTQSKYHYYFHPTVAIHSEEFFYFMIGLITLLVFVGFPPCLFLVYSCSLFRVQLGRLNTRLRIALQIFGDSFLGGFKDGTNGRSDYRWFGSAYLIFRIVIFGVYVSPTNWANQYLIQQILFTLGIFLFAIARPYKDDFFNYLDITFFVLFSILNSLSMYNSHLIMIHSDNEPNRGVFYLNYLLLFLPYVYLLLLVVYYVFLDRMKVWFTRSKKITKVYGEQTSNYSDQDIRDKLSCSDQEEFPDRVLNPDEYSSLTPMSGVLSEASKKMQPQQRAKTDHSFFAEGARDKASKAEYGSVVHQDRATAPLLGRK